MPRNIKIICPSRWAQTWRYPATIEAGSRTKRFGGLWQIDDNAKKADRWLSR
jgi:hypothetical protein